jgi:hypothetical protein
MRKLTLLLSVILGGIMVNAQPKTNNPNDTLPTKDSIAMELKDQMLDNIPVVSLDENSLGDGSSQNISSVLTAGRDPFFSAASFNFSAVRYRVRGYDADANSTYMNGIPMENLDNGFTPFGLWGGLNDVMRNRDLNIGLRPTTFAFGDIGSTTNIDARASKQRKQTQFGYAFSNRSYTHRWNITHSTGISKKGWAFTVSGSRRWADEGYVPGTYYDGWSYFAAVDKRLGQKHLLSLTVFGAPTETGRQSGATQESMNLAGTHYYNPTWGYQNGKVRNAAVGKTNQPFIILTHDFRINNNTTLNTAAGYSFGERSTTALDWYNAPDPRPDYYRNLPNYYYINNDIAGGKSVENAFLADPNLLQLNWHRLYDVNRSSYETVKNVNGIAGNNVSGKRSHYIIEDRVIDANRFNFNTVINSRLGNHVDLSGGASYQYLQNNYFKRVDDLLGGDFYVDLNQFAERDFPANPTANQNDVNNPNRLLKQGDKFGYNYDINVNRAAAWAQSVFKFTKVDFFVAAELSNTNFWRVGHVTNGLFPNNSFGKSKVYDFTNYAVKGGVTYKINGKNYLYVNGAYQTRAPFFENVYISPRTRDIAQDNVTDEKVASVEAGYILNAPKIKLRLSGYYTRFEDQMNVLSFYHDEVRNLVNVALNNIDKLHYGTEFGFEAKILPNVTLNGAAGIGTYIYDSRQNSKITVDNNSQAVDIDQSKQLVYSQNFRVGSTPQQAYSLGVSYRSPKYWFVSLTGNYFDDMYLDFSPIRRTNQAVDGLDVTKDADNTIYHQVIDQTKWDPQYTVDFFGGYSWKLPKSFGLKKATFLVINAGVNNLTNNKDIVTGGYEQLRFDFQGKNANKFPPKLYYAYGLNYFLGLTLRF